MIIIPNILLAYGITKTNQLTSNAFNIFALIICISEVIFGVVMVPFDNVYYISCQQELHGRVFNDFLSTIHCTSYNIFCTILALLRYIQINIDMKEPGGLKKWPISKYFLVILLIFLGILGFLLSVWHGLASNYVFGNFINGIPNLIIKGIDGIMLIVFLLLYMQLFWRIRSHVRSSIGVGGTSSVFLYGGNI